VGHRRGTLSSAKDGAGWRNKLPRLPAALWRSAGTCMQHIAPKLCCASSAPAVLQPGSLGRRSDLSTPSSALRFTYRKLSHAPSNPIALSSRTMSRRVLLLAVDNSDVSMGGKRLAVGTGQLAGTAMIAGTPPVLLPTLCRSARTCWSGPSPTCTKMETRCGSGLARQHVGQQAGAAGRRRNKAGECGDTRRQRPTVLAACAVVTCLSACGLPFDGETVCPAAAVTDCVALLAALAAPPRNESQEILSTLSSSSELSTHAAPPGSLPTRTCPLCWRRFTCCTSFLCPCPRCAKGRAGGARHGPAQPLSQLPLPNPARTGHSPSCICSGALPRMLSERSVQQGPRAAVMVCSHLCFKSVFRHEQACSQHAHWRLRANCNVLTAGLRVPAGDWRHRRHGQHCHR